MAEKVNHPAHYGGADNPFETIKVLEAKLTPEEFVGFCKGNAVKYLDRAKFKKKGSEEIEHYQKARWYLDRLINYMENKKNAPDRT